MKVIYIVFLIGLVFGGIHSKAEGLNITTSPDQSKFGGRIQRTMTLLESSDLMHKRTIKILFYGQSIIKHLDTSSIVNRLRKRYPYANIISKNMAIGGFTANMLYKPALQDIAAYYPDLIVFHVYEGAFGTAYWERIIYNIRKYTTAEIMIFTHHLAWATGEKNLHNRTVSDDWDSNNIRYVAQKYNCEIIEVRKEWKDYLKTEGIAPNKLIGDTIHNDVHPNAAGNELLTELIMRHFRFNTTADGGWYKNIRLYDPRRSLEGMIEGDEINLSGEWQKTKYGITGAVKGSRLKLKFTGNRVDILSMPNDNPGSAKILIDGNPPSSYSELYAVTRSSPAFETWFPAIHRITLGKNPICEKWTLKIIDILDTKAEKLKYELKGSETGIDGTGNSWEKFTSDSGRIILLPEYFGIAIAQRVTKKLCPIDFEVTWEVKPMFIDLWKPAPAKDIATEDRYTLAQGLSNSEHILEIFPNGDGNIPVRSIVVYRPPIN